MAEANQSSSCATRWGLCMNDPRCQDTACPGHPGRTCSTCRAGVCQAPEACFQPVIEPPAPKRARTFSTNFGITGPHLPRTRAGWGRVIQAAFGIAGLFFIAGAMARHWGIL